MIKITKKTIRIPNKTFNLCKTSSAMIPESSLLVYYIFEKLN